MKAQIIVIGGGFAGLQFIQNLKENEFEIMLIVFAKPKAWVKYQALGGNAIAAAALNTVVKKVPYLAIHMAIIRVVLHVPRLTLFVHQTNR